MTAEQIRAYYESFGQREWQRLDTCPVAWPVAGMYQHTSHPDRLLLDNESLDRSTTDHSALRAICASSILSQ